MEGYCDDLVKPSSGNGTVAGTNSGDVAGSDGTQNSDADDGKNVEEHLPPPNIPLPTAAATGTGSGAGANRARVQLTTKSADSAVLSGSRHGGEILTPVVL